MPSPDDVFPPEFYADSLQIGTSPWGFIFTFGLLSEGGPRPVATVRMSPQHAKVMALMLKRIVHQYEEQVGPITFPAAFYDELNLPEEL